MLLNCMVRKKNYLYLKEEQFWALGHLTISVNLVFNRWLYSVYVIWNIHNILQIFIHATKGKCMFLLILPCATEHPKMCEEIRLGRKKIRWSKASVVNQKKQGQEMKNTKIKFICCYSNTLSVRAPFFGVKLNNRLLSRRTQIERFAVKVIFIDTLAFRIGSFPLCCDKIYGFQGHNFLLYCLKTR